MTARKNKPFELQTYREAPGVAAAPATVVVFGGEPIVGQALEVLLQTSGYNARFVAESLLRQPGMLDGAQVLLVAPGCNAASREAVMTMIGSEPGGRGVAVLEMGMTSAGGGRSLDPERYIPWPCRSEELARRIDAVLAAGPGANKDKKETKQEVGDDQNSR